MTTAAPAASTVVMTAITWIETVIQNRDTKRELAKTNKNSNEGDCPPDGNTDMKIVSSVCGDANDIKSDDDEEEISVNESNESNNNFPDDLLNVLYGKSTHDNEGDNEGVQDGQQH